MIILCVFSALICPFNPISLPVVELCNRMVYACKWFYSIILKEKQDKDGDLDPE